MNIIYIHGNGATADSFNYIRTQLPEYQGIALSYDSADGFHTNLRRMQRQLRETDDIFFIAHSLGGIYALHLAHALHDQVLGAVTMSTPYGGSKAAQAVKYVLPFNRVLRDIQPYSAPILEGDAIRITQPWTNIVTTGGHSLFMLEANDGVVTQESMRHREDMALLEVRSNHFEVLLNNEVIAVIRKALRKAESSLARQEHVA